MKSKVVCRGLLSSLVSALLSFTGKGKVCILGIASFSTYMQNIRVTISLPSDLVKELKKVEKLEQCSSFSDLMRHIVTSYLEERRKIKMLQEMEE